MTNNLNMNIYQHLAGTHDLNLPDWGPYSRNYFGISHLADKIQGSRFDFFMVPGIYRRELFVPDTLKECGLVPWDTSCDLNFYSYRQQMSPDNKTYAEISYSRINDDFRLARCNFVNTTGKKLVNVLHLFSGLFLRHESKLQPKLPAGSYWLAAVDYDSLDFASPRYDDALTWDGHRRAEETSVPDSVSGNCIGRNFWQNIEPGHGFGFGYDAGDVIRFRLQRPENNGFVQLRYLLATGKSLKLQVRNVTVQEAELTGSGRFETAVIYRGKLNSDTLEIVSCGGEEITLDGLVIGKMGNESHTGFTSTDFDNTPAIEEGPIKNSSIISYNCLPDVYGLWWSCDNSVKRTFNSENLINTLNHSYSIRNPYFLNFNYGSKEKFAETFIIPVILQPHSSEIIYSIIGNGNRKRLAEELRTLTSDTSKLELIYQKNYNSKIEFNPTPAGEKFVFGQKLMTSVTLTNLTYPIYVKRHFIRHHTPARYYNSLYSWDSGFIGLGLLELDKQRAIENLNVYVTEPGDEEAAFILHGTPVPVQAYLYEEIWNRFQDREMLEFFYPRLKQYYRYLAGHVASSTIGTLKSHMLKTWDYFYNSGGWDDYPPQWQIFLDKEKNIAPVVNTAHAIRFAKILSQAAAELGLENEIASYQEDIQIFTQGLQQYSWDRKSGYFSYVRHNQQGEPLGFYYHESGANFNMGLDGLTPLLAGVCTTEQKKIMFAKLQSRQHLWTPVGLSTVDMAAPYYRNDGYWNGSVWMPHQWFFWKSALDHGMGDFARKIAMTALKLWKKETDETHYCFEHFSIDSGRGCMSHNFSGLSCPVLNWFNAYFIQGRLTGGFDTWVRKAETSPEPSESWRFELRVDGEREDFTTLIFVSGPGTFQVEYNNGNCAVEQPISGTMEIKIPKKSQGVLVIKRVCTC